MDMDSRSKLTKCPNPLADVFNALLVKDIFILAQVLLISFSQPKCLFLCIYKVTL